MTTRELIAEIDRRDLLGSPVKLYGGREFGGAATGWYYSPSHSLCCIGDAVLQHGCGYRHRGEAADNVRGPFGSKSAALADLAEFVGDDDGRAWAEGKIADDDARIAAAAARPEARRLRRKAKRARNLASRELRAGLGCA